MSKTAKILFTLTIFSSITLFGQIKAEKTIELTQERYQDNLYVFLAEEESFLHNYPSNKNEIWNIQKFNSELKLEKTTQLTIDGYHLMCTYQKGAEFLMLFENDQKAYRVYSIQTETLNSALVTEGQFAANNPLFLPQRLRFFDDVICISGEMAKGYKREPQIMLLSREGEDSKSIVFDNATYQAKSVSLLQWEIIEERNEIFVLVQAWDEETKWFKYYVESYELDGKKKSSVCLSDWFGGNIIEAEVIYKDGEYLLSGTFVDKDHYAKKAPKLFKHTSRKLTDFMGEVEGLFTCKINTDGVEFFKTQKFIDCANFIQLLPKENQNEQTKEKLKKNPSLWYSVPFNLTHVEMLNNQLIVLGEAYHVEQLPSTNGAPNPELFYTYTHAAIMVFDLSGKLIWDQVLELSPSFAGNPYMRHVHPISISDEDDIHLMNANLSGVESIQLDLKNGSLIQQKNAESPKYLDHWFAETFLDFQEDKTTLKISKYSYYE
jgi:hypothetical protein